VIDLLLLSLMINQTLSSLQTSILLPYINPMGVAQEDEAIDGWLPINARRNAKWWYSAFHNVTAMVGAGVLGLPYAMSQLGWYVDI
jgi:hypothetical protein